MKESDSENERVGVDERVGDSETVKEQLGDTL